MRLTTGHLFIRGVPLLYARPVEQVGRYTPRIKKGTTMSKGLIITACLVTLWWFVAQTIGMKPLWQYIGSGLIGLLVGLL